MAWKLSKNVFVKTVNTAQIQRCFPNSMGGNHNKYSISSTIDTSEVELFAKYMNEWWKPDGEFSLLHSYNTLRVPFIRDGLVQCSIEQRVLHPLKDKQILDVGCGGGILSEALATLGAKVTGLDASKQLVDVAKAHADLNEKIANNKPSYIKTTIEDHAKQVADHYDGVVASEVIEHVNNPQLFVQSCVHTLKPGGRIFFTTPNKTRLSQFVVIFLCEYVFKYTPQGAHQYEKFIAPTELTFMLERNNCQVESTFGLQYNPINKKWSFTKYQDLVYALQARKLSQK